MVDFDPSNPLAIVTGFFAIMFTFLLFIIKFGISMGFAGIFVGLLVFMKIMFADKTT